MAALDRVYEVMQHVLVSLEHAAFVQKLGQTKRK
jgi:hypothetical protein